MKLGSARSKKSTILHKRSFPFEQASEEGTGECLSDNQGKEHTQREMQCQDSAWHLLFTNIFTDFTSVWSFLGIQPHSFFSNAVYIQHYSVLVSDMQYNC